MFASYVKGSVHVEWMVKSVLVVNVSIKSCMVAFICIIKTGSLGESSFSSEFIRESCFGCFYMYSKNRKCQ